MCTIRRHLTSTPHLICTLFLAIVGGCSRPDEKLVVAAVRQPATALFYVASDSGCFARERLIVEERSFDLGRDALPAMLGGNADVAIAYETPVLRVAQTGTAVRALTTLHTSTRNTRLIAHRKSGIERFRDLKGRRLGVAGGTNADFFSNVLLTFGGLSRSDVEVHDLAPEASVRALIERRIDAAVLSDPPADTAETALGRDAVVLPTELYAEVSLLVSQPETIQRRRPALLALMRGLACAERLSREAPERALALIRRRFPEEDEARLRREIERVHWGLGLDNVLLEVLRREAEWLQSSGVAQASPATAIDLLDASLLEEIEPDAVMLLPRLTERPR